MGNIGSPSIKSPEKDYGINERIEIGRDKIIKENDRWKSAEASGSQCVSLIHNLKTKARTADSDNLYPPELATYCEKLKIIATVFEDVISSVIEFRREISGSISILESMDGNDELKQRLIYVEKFLDALANLYEANRRQKLLVVGKLITISIADSF